MNRDYLPSQGPQLLQWAENFSAKITATPTAYGLVAADATAFAALVADFAARLAAATDPATRTKVTMQARDVSRAALKARARALARVVNACQTVTNVQRAELGLTVRNPEPTPIPPPPTQAVASIAASGGGQALLRIADELAPTSRAKPAGALAAVLFTKIDGPAPVSVDDARYAGLATRHQHVIDLPAGSAGKTLYVMARWVNERGQHGPVGPVASAMIAA